MLLGWHGGAACRVTLRWTHGPDHLPADPEDAMATLTCPGCAATVSHDDLICFTCGTNLPRRGPVTEESTPPTVMQEYLRPDGSAAPGTPRPAGPISPVVLRLSFPAGYENVSRRHATITVSDTGQATIRDEYSTNGTFVNEDRVLPGTDVRITDGDRVRLAADVTAEVSLPGRSGFSSNGHQSH